MMPRSRRSLALPSDPAAVRLARSWVSDVLIEVDRPDLVAGAKQAVSELVTNAILHADPPLVVRVAGTRAHPRVEVADGSTRPLREVRLPDEDDMVTTFGRGLALVAVNSTLWGWDTNPDGSGKTVWFEPAPEMHDDFDLAAIGDEHAPGHAAPDLATRDFVSIELHQMPARLFGRLRRYHFELRRELRLLAFSDPEQYPLAVQVTDAFARGDAERTAARGVQVLDQAIANGVDFVDLRYDVPSSAPDTMGELLELFERVRAEFAGEQLLAVTPDEELLSLQRWYFTEFVRQGRGEEPLAWEPPPSARPESAS